MSLSDLPLRKWHRIIQASLTEWTRRVLVCTRIRKLTINRTETDSNKKDDVLPNEEMKKMPLQETMVVSKVATVNRETQRTVFQALIMVRYFPSHTLQ
ncbi:hypothetical protein J6590_050366 [Homalodisca vitripennis]|nr:hypothetical protein J6590_050366 [Homalodisca vitripennis]